MRKHGNDGLGRRVATADKGSRGSPSKGRLQETDSTRFTMTRGIGKPTQRELRIAQLGKLKRQDAVRRYTARTE
jgi:hypothetical protein